MPITGTGERRTALHPQRPGRQLVSVIPLLLFCLPLFAQTRVEHLHHDSSAPWNTPWTIADLDGDSVPDVAESVLDGHDERGYVYRVVIAARQHLFVHSHDAQGVNLVLRDIDGDHDPDLIITSAVTRMPLAVWINDGHGGFAPAPQSTLAKVASEHAPSKIFMPLGVRIPLLTDGNSSQSLSTPALLAQESLVEDRRTNCAESLDISAGFVPMNAGRAPPSQA